MNLTKKILDIIAWTSFIIFVIYAILKVTGVIHSLDWIAVLTIGVFIGRYAMKIDNVEGGIKDMKNNISEVEGDLGFVKTDIETIKENCSIFDKKK